jgi:hypothetical protein
LLTTPNFDYRAIVPEHAGTFSIVEDGGHVRRGYTRAELVTLCEESGLSVNEVDSCSGFLSQKATWVTYTTGKVNPTLARLLTAPLHPLVATLDSSLTRWVDWPPYSFCIEATKLPSAARGAAA